MLAHCDPTQPFGKLGKAIAAALRKAYVDGQQDERETIVVELQKEYERSRRSRTCADHETRQLIDAENVGIFVCLAMVKRKKNIQKLTKLTEDYKLRCRKQEINIRNSELNDRFK